MLNTNCINMQTLFRLLFSSFTIITSLSVFAQQNISHIWSRSISNTMPAGGYINYMTVKVDVTGNSYITGSFQGTIDFDPSVTGTTNLSSAGSGDIFFAKYDSSGNYIYAKRIGGSGNEQANSLTVDSNGNIYLTGVFEGIVDFDPGPGTANLNAGIFFSKYDAAGNYIYAKRIGGAGSDKCYDITLDEKNNVYVTGLFIGTKDFDPGAGIVNLTSSGGNSSDIFFAKYDTSGNYVYAKSIGSWGYEHGYRLATDSSGNVYVTGVFEGTVDFDPGNGIANLSSAGNADIFFAKYDTTGNYVYAKRLGGASFVNCNSLVVDRIGNVYITGSFQSTIDFDPDLGTVNLTSSSGSADIFFAKYNISGNYVYAKRIGGSQSDVGNSLSLDNNNNIYIGGFFGGTVDFDPGIGIVNLTSAGGNDIFFAKYDSFGNYIYAKGMGGGSTELDINLSANTNGVVFISARFEGTVDFDPGSGIIYLSGDGFFLGKYASTGSYLYAKSLGSNDFEDAISLKVNKNGDVYITGSFKGTVDFDPGPGTAILTSNGGTDIFFAKYNGKGEYLYAKSIGSSGNDLSHSIAIDSIGNLYLTGDFWGSVDFNPGPDTAALVSISNSDIFFAKYDTSGNYVYAKRIGGSFTIAGSSLAVDNTGSLYMTGSFQGFIDFDPGIGTATLLSAGSNDVFFAKYDSLGNYVYAKRMGGINNDAANCITLDSKGNLYITGQFVGTVDFDSGPTTINLTSEGDSDAFFAKYDNSGNYIYAKRIGTFGQDIGRTLIVDDSGYVYMTGLFFNQVDFDPGPGIAYATIFPGFYNAFAKYDSLGNYVYAKSLVYTHFYENIGLALDGNGNVYLAGSFEGSVDFDPNPGPPFTSAGAYDMFISKYDAAGNYIYAKRIGSNGVDKGRSIIVDGNGNLYVSGTFENTVDFDPSTDIANLVSSGSSSVFIARYGQCSSPILPIIHGRVRGQFSTISGVTTLTDGGCRLLAVISPMGPSPVNGSINSWLWIESSIPTFSDQPFVARHYEITPLTNASTATGKVTLFFTQEEFNDLNNHPGSTLNLPVGPSDASGKANLLVVKYNGTSNDGSGLPGSYTGGATIINPADTDIIWNSSASRWEVSIDATGFGGFFVQTNTVTSSSDYLDFEDRALRIYPNPVQHTLTLKLNIFSKPLQLRLTDLSGRVIKTWNYRQAATILQLDVHEVPSGNYLLEVWQEVEKKQLIHVIKQ